VKRKNIADELAAAMSEAAVVSKSEAEPAATRSYPPLLDVDPPPSPLKNSNQARFTREGYSMH
jgi:hypothetical protein